MRLRNRARARPRARKWGWVGEVLENSKRPLGIAPAAAHLRQHKDAGVFVPEGPDGEPDAQ
jgi:hypothetical protein